MTTQFPVDPDDVAQLLRIRRYLIGFRHTNGWTQAQLSVMVNGTEGAAYDLESNETWQWRMSRLQSWVKAFGLRLDARLVFASMAMNAAIHAHPEVAPFYQLSRGTQNWAMWQRCYLTSALSVARKDLGVSTAEMARRLGITRKAVSNWERDADEVLLPKVLHCARVLGGRIRLRLEEAGDVPA